MPAMNKPFSALNGRTILRFTYSQAEGSGGIEQYLDDLNKHLLIDHKLTIIQFCLNQNNKVVEQKIENIGLGTLIKIAMPQQNSNFTNNRAIPEIINTIKRLTGNAKRSFINCILNFPIIGLWAQLLQRALPLTKDKPCAYNYSETKKLFYKIFNSSHISLVTIHGLSIYQIDEFLIRESIKRKIPFLIINHFNNSIFNLLSARKIYSLAKAVAGVSSLNVPKYLWKKFYNLGDGIDTNFFKKENARKLIFPSSEPIILLPARISAEKGHFDLLKAAFYLRKQNINCRIVSIGRCEAPEIAKKLEKFNNSRDSVDLLLIGDLSREELRDWYGECKIVVLPSKSEGLPRVLLEAQAMELPVIAYNVGGVSAVIKNNITGYLLKKGSIKELAIRIKELLIDEAKRKQMGEAGRKFVEENYRIDALVKRHVELYKKMMCD